MNMIDWLFVIRANYKKNFNNNFCQVYCFNFQFNQDSRLLKHIVRVLGWHIKFEKCKALTKKISEELMPIAWHPKRWRNFCMPEDEKKKI